MSSPEEFYFKDTGNIECEPSAERDCHEILIREVTDKRSVNFQLRVTTNDDEYDELPPHPDSFKINFVCGKEKLLPPK